MISVKEMLLGRLGEVIDGGGLRPVIHEEHANVGTVYAYNLAGGCEFSVRYDIQKDSALVVVTGVRVVELYEGGFFVVDEDKGSVYNDSRVSSLPLRDGAGRIEWSGAWVASDRARLVLYVNYTDGPRMNRCFEVLAVMAASPGDRAMFDRDTGDQPAVEPVADPIRVCIETVDIVNDPILQRFGHIEGLAAVCWDRNEHQGMHFVIGGRGEAAERMLLDLIDAAGVYQDVSPEAFGADRGA